MNMSKKKILLIAVAFVIAAVGIVAASVSQKQKKMGPGRSFCSALKKLPKKSWAKISSVYRRQSLLLPSLTAMKPTRITTSIIEF